MAPLIKFAQENVKKDKWQRLKKKITKKQEPKQKQTNNNKKK